MPEYRKNVGVVVFNKDLKVWMGARADQAGMQWQFPQGGIEDNEDVVEAAKRELAEETGITSVQFVAISSQAWRYDFPPEIFERFKQLGRTNIGQEQRWVLFYFCGDDSEIDFKTNPQEIEFNRYEWVDMAEAIERIVGFKKEVYCKVELEFSPIIEHWGK